jgi:hypothetical protein
VQVQAQAASLTDAQRAVQAVQRQRQAAQAAHCRERGSWERAAARARREHAAQLHTLEAGAGSRAQQVPPGPDALHRPKLPGMLGLLWHAFRAPDVCLRMGVHLTAGTMPKQAEEEGLAREAKAARMLAAEAADAAALRKQLGAAEQRAHALQGEASSLTEQVGAYRLSSLTFFCSTAGKWHTH